MSNKLIGVIEDDNFDVQVQITERGLPGKDGYTPIKGVDYFDGEKGDTGEQGIPGNDGYTPIKGVDYFDGEKGLSAYEVWLNQGNEGTVEDYLSSLKGSDAEVTIENIKKALGYTPADAKSEHEHVNKEVIDKFTELENKPYYNDEAIATVKDIPLNTSELTNDSGYVAQDGLDNRVRFITETQYDTLKTNNNIEENITYIIYK